MSFLLGVFLFWRQQSFIFRSLLWLIAVTFITFRRFTNFSIRLRFLWFRLLQKLAGLACSRIWRARVTNFFLLFSAEINATFLYVWKAVWLEGFLRVWIFWHFFSGLGQTLFTSLNCDWLNRLAATIRFFLLLIQIFEWGTEPWLRFNQFFFRSFFFKNFNLSGLMLTFFFWINFTDRVCLVSYLFHELVIVVLRLFGLRLKQSIRSTVSGLLCNDFVFFFFFPVGDSCYFFVLWDSSNLA